MHACLNCDTTSVSGSNIECASHSLLGGARAHNSSSGQCQRAPPPLKFASVWLAKPSPSISARAGATRTNGRTKCFRMSSGLFSETKFVHDSLHVFLREVFGADVCWIFLVQAFW